MFAEELTELKAQCERAFEERVAMERDLVRTQAELVREQAQTAKLEDDLIASREQTARESRKASELHAVAARLPILEGQRDAEKLRADQLAEKLDLAKSKLVDSATTEKALSATVAERDRELVELQDKIESDKQLISAVYAMASAQRAVLELTKT
jgi:hypothetical protein